jgi:hypothetical protein
MLPIYGWGRALLGYVSVSAAQRMLRDGSVLPRGTKQCIRGLIAIQDNLDLMPAERTWRNQHDSHTGESKDNPKGVWTFRKLSAL